MAENAQSQAAAVRPLVCPGHTQSVHEVFVTRQTEDGVFIASACQDRTAMMRDGSTGDWIGTFQGHKGAVWSAHLDPQATRCATGSADFTAKYWDATSGTELHNFSHPHVVKVVRIGGDDSSKLLTGGYEKKLRIYDLNQPDSEPTKFPETKDFVKTAMWHCSHPNIFYSGSPKEHAMRVWDLRQAECVNQIDLPGQLLDLEMLEGPQVNGVLTLTTRDENHVMIFDTDAKPGEPKLLYDHQLQDINLTSATLHPNFKNQDTAIFATGESGNYHGPKREKKEESETNWVRLFNLVDGQPITHMKGHHGPVSSVRWHPTGDRIVSGSDDGTVRMWQRPGAEN